MSNDGERLSGPVCDCLQVDARRIEHAVRALGLRTVDEVTDCTGAGGGCHCCRSYIEEILARCARGDYRVPMSAEELAKARRAGRTVRRTLLPGATRKPRPSRGG